MKNFYFFVVGILTLTAFLPTKASAQCYTFEGPTGNMVIIDYNQGLTGNIENKKVTILDPFAMAKREFLPLGDSLVKDQERLSFLKDKYNEAIALAESLETTIDEGNQAYGDAIITDLDQIQNLLNVYLLVAEDIESRLNSATRVTSRAKQPTDLIDDLLVFMTDFDYLQWHLDFCQEYLLDLCDEIIESATSCTEDMNEAAARVNEWRDLLAILSDNAVTITEYYEENYDNFTYNGLVELLETIDSQVQVLNALTQEIGDNAEAPIDKEFALGFIIDTANTTYAEMEETTEELSALIDSYNNVATNFMPVLMGFAENATSGMYVYLTYNDGVLNIPSELTFVEDGGPVVAIDGNIFGEDYPNGFPALKSIVIPSTVESIKNGAFGIEGIQSVKVMGDIVPELQTDCFTDNVYANATLYVKDSLKSAFMSDASWGRFKKIESLPGSGTDMIESDNISVKVVGMKLIINCAEGDNITVWSSNGNMISSGEREIELPAKGVYIIKAGNKVVKAVC